MPRRLTRISSVIVESLQLAALDSGRAHGPFQASPTRMASGRGPQLFAGAADADLEPARRGPRCAGVSDRVVPACRPPVLDGRLVRRSLPPPLQPAFPAARGAARPAAGGDAGGGRLFVFLRSLGPGPLGRGGALGDAL